ncbi:MAG: SIMPL domain-containing protein [Hyphomicrobiaceae bacterium]
MSRAEDQRIARTVSVSATGSVSAEPDQAAISTGVMVEGETARAALSANSVQMAKLIEGLKAVGIAPKDIKTTVFNISPRYHNNKDGRPATINGYQVHNQVRILVRAIDSLGQVLDTAVTLGANQIGGIEFQVSTADNLMDDARKAAMANALRRAKLYAASAQAEVGEVLAIADDMASPPLRPMVMARAAMSTDAVPVERGTQSLEVRVNVIWALK